MNLWLFFILRREEFDKLRLCCDVAGVLLAELLGLRQHPVLHLIQQARDVADKFIFSKRLLILGCTVAATNHHIASLDISWPDFNANGDTLLDPVPGLFTTTHVAIVKLNLHGRTHVSLAFERLLQVEAVIEHFLTRLFLRSEWNDNNMRGRNARRQH